MFYFIKVERIQILFKKTESQELFSLLMGRFTVHIFYRNKYLGLFLSKTFQKGELIMIVMHLFHIFKFPDI